MVKQQRSRFGGAWWIGIAIVVLAASTARALDPVVGPEIGIDQRITASIWDSDGRVQGQAVAFDGTNYLVVWADDRKLETTPVAVRNVYGARITPSGSLLDPQGILITTAEEAGVPDVAYDGTNYLVVWQQGVGLETDIFGARVSKAGVVLDPTSISITSIEGYQARPAVACDSTNCLATWRDGRSDVANNIYGARVSATGEVLDAEGIALSTLEQVNQLAPAIAFDGTNYLVAWQDDRDSPPGTLASHIYATRVSPAGSALDPDGILLSAVDYSMYPAIAFDGTTYLVVWSSGATRVSVDGDVLDPTGIALPAAGITGVPAVEFDGTEYLIAWANYVAPRNQMYGVRVSMAGVALDADGVVLRSDASGDSVHAPALAFDGTNYLMAWGHQAEGVIYQDIKATRVSPDPVTLDSPPLQIAAGPHGEDEPAAAFDGTNYLVVWQDSRNGDDDIYAARVDAEGTLLDPTGIVLSAADHAQRTPKVAFDGTNYLVVWQDFRDSADGDIYGTRVSKTGVVLESGGVALSTAAHGQGAPALAFGGTNYLVVWSDGRSGTNDDIYATRVSKAGAVLDASGVAVASATSDESSPALTFDGENYLVAWAKVDDGTSRGIYAARVSAGGAVLDAAGIAISTAPGDQVAPSVAFDGTYSLVVWEEFRNGASADIYAARVTKSGVCIDDAGLIIANAAAAQSRPTVGFDGLDYVIAWQDERSGVSADVYAARVKSSGSVRDPNGFVVAASNTDDATSALAFSADGRGLVFYRRANDPAFGPGWRVKARTLHSAHPRRPGVSDYDAGTEEEANADSDAGRDSASGGNGAGGTGASGNDGASGKGAAGNGVTGRTDAGTQPTLDAGDRYDDGGPARSVGKPIVFLERSGCNCSVERANRTPPFGLLVFAMIATARLLTRHRRTARR